MDQNPPKEFRPPVNLRIKFRSESVDQFIERYAVDVSRGGIFIRTREPLAVGTQLKLDFQFQNGTALMAGDGTVVWIREFDPNRTSVPPGMGVRFDKLTPESQSVLEQLLIEKAKRERSGVPGSVTQGAGGIAVRRSSSTFAPLDAAGAAGRASAPAASVPASTSAPSSGPLAAVTSQSPALQPLSPSPSSSKTSPTTAAGDPTTKGETPAYRPLGKARNPFSSIGAAEPTPAPTPAARDSALSGTASEAAGDSAAPFDDISDEPTQIAGRLPSFLLSDDDATVANAVSPPAAPHKPEVAGTAAATSKKGSKGKGGDKVTPKSKETGTETATASSRTSLPGMARRDSAATSESVAKGDQGGEAIKGEADAVTGEPARALAPDSESGGSTSTAGSSAGTRSSGSELAVGGDAASATSAAGEPGGSAAAGDTARPAEITAPVAPPAAAAGTQPARTGSARTGSVQRRPGAVVVAATVLVLGAGGIFLFRFFSSQSTQTGPGMTSTAATVEGTEAPPAPGTTAAGAPQVAAEPGPAPSGEAGGEMQPAAGETGAVPGPPSPKEGEVGGPAALANPAAAVTPPAVPPETGGAPQGASEATGRRSAARSKALRASRQSDAATAKASPGVVDQSADKSGEPTVATAGSAPSPAAGPTAASPVTAEQPSSAANGDTAIHQIRVTSKPDGAEVTLDGQAVGKTPFAVGISDTTTSHTVTVHKEGFEPFEQMISASSAWSKPKPVKGKGTLQVLKINARLKPVGGVQVRAAGDAEPGSTEPAGNKAQASGSGKTEGAAAPTDARPAAESPP